MRGKTLVVSSKMMFDPNGAHRIYDVLQDQIGVRVAPDNITIPWTLVLRTGVTIAVWADGRVKASTLTTAVGELETAEHALSFHLGARWVIEEQYLRESKGLHGQASFGQMSSNVQQKLSSVFR